MNEGVGGGWVGGWMDGRFIQQQHTYMSSTCTVWCAAVTEKTRL